VDGIILASIFRTGQKNTFFQMGRLPCNFVQPARLTFATGKGIPRPLIIPSDMKRAYWYLHISVLFLALSAIFGKLISLSELLLSWYRVVFAAIILWLLLQKRSGRPALSLREKFHIGKYGVLLTLSWVFFYGSIKYANISIGVVCACMASFFTAIFSPLITRTPFMLSEFLLNGLTLLGIGLIFSFDSSMRLGILLGIFSPVFFSLYYIYNKKLAATYDVLQINYYQMIGGAAGLSVILPFYLHYFPGTELIPGLKDTAYLIILASVCTVLVYILVTEALKKISAFTANLTMNLEPIYAIIIAFIFFQEGRDFNNSFYLGLLLVILSVILQSRISIKDSRLTP